MRTERRRSQVGGGTYPWIVESTAMVNHYYFYIPDRDFGPLGALNLRARPSRSLTVTGLIATAVFMVLSVASFRKQVGSDWLQRSAGTGGFALRIETTAQRLMAEKALREKGDKEKVARLEKELSKMQLLEFYINYVALGSGNYGVEAAARRYFSKPASELTLVESATLAGARALGFDADYGSIEPGKAARLLADGLKALARRAPIYAYEFEGERYDAGTPVGAINGDFYENHEHYEGRPRDLQVLRGELVSGLPLSEPASGSFTSVSRRV